MNELRPAMFRLLPAGGGGAGTAGRGNRMAVRAAATLCSSIRFLPAAVPSAATAAAAPLEIRNRRRAGQRDDLRSSGLSRKVKEYAGPARTVGLATSAGRSGTSEGAGRSGGASAPLAAAVLARAAGGEPSPAAARASKGSAIAPAAAPT